MKIKSIIGCIIGTALLAIVAIGAQLNLVQDHKHTDDVNKRGDQAMGFDHLKTTHHFLLKNDGGIIQVEANDASDDTSRDQIRMHMRHISHMFSTGDFNIPMFVHDREVPGTKTMARLKDSINYGYQETKDGARVVIISKDTEGLKAIHEFLRFQIQDHKTNDPMEVK